VEVATAVVEPKSVARGGLREVAPEDGDPVVGEADLGRVVVEGRVVRCAVEARRAERVSVEVGKAAAAANVLVALVHFEVQRRSEAAVVPGRVQFLAVGCNANACPNGKAERDSIAADVAF